MLNFIEKEIKSAELNVYGVEIHKNDELIYKLQLSDNIRYPIYSATKTITSAAFGLAKSDGKISENDLIADYFEKKYLNKLRDDSLSSFKKLTVERFLTMSVQGFPFRPESSDWLEFSLMSNENYNRKPVFAYSNIPAYLVGIACENALGIPLYEYLNKKLFTPLGIEAPPYQACPNGHFYGATGMKLTVNELSRIGRLYLNGGVYNGYKILSNDWIKSSISKHIDNSEGGYGYFVWTNGKNFSINGKWGQRCLVYPEKHLTITYLSNLPERSREMMKIAEKAAEIL